MAFTTSGIAFYIIACQEKRSMNLFVFQDFQVFVIFSFYSYWGPSSKVSDGPHDPPSINIRISGHAVPYVPGRPPYLYTRCCAV